ncbi:MAG: hypothetical protein ACK5RO_00785 [Pseudobdellovibrionaceae bacterium]|jgi:hypothetical protein
MKNLNLCKIVVLFLWACSGCTTSSFKIKKETDSTTVLMVNSDRILLQCEELDEDPDIGAYGFMIHMLDEENTVTTSALNIRPDKKNCEKIMQAVDRIIKKHRLVYVGSRFNLSKQPRIQEEVRLSYTFPNHGTFVSNGRALDFVYISNAKGMCYAPNLDPGEACPPYPFSIENYTQ